MEIQITFLMSFSLRIFEDLMNPGKCFVEQVGVNAPGSPNKIILSSPIICFIEVSLGSLSKIKTFASGRLSPSFILIVYLHYF